MAAGEGFPLQTEHACPPPGQEDREQREGAHPATDKHLQQIILNLTTFNSDKPFYIGEVRSSKLAICVLSVIET